MQSFLTGNFIFSMNALFNCSKILNALIVFYETINYRILKPRKEVGMDVVIADCTKQYGY